MNRNIKRVVATVITLTIALSLVGCGIKKDVEMTVDSFFEDVTSGRYADRVFRSDHVTDDPFSQIEVKDERLWNFIEEGLSQLNYQMGKVTGKSTDEPASCIIKLEMIDVASVYATSFLRTYDEDELFETMFRPMAPRKEVEIELFFTYDAQDERWIINDSSQFYEAFITPYLEISIPFAQSPEEAFEQNIEELRADNYETVFDELKANNYAMLYDEFLADDGSNYGSDLEEMFDLLIDTTVLFLSKTTYEVISVEIEGTRAVLEVRETYISYQFFLDMSIDEDVVYNIFRELILLAKDGIEMKDEDLLIIYLTESIKRLNQFNLPTEDTYLTVYMIYDIDGKIWHEISTEYDDVFWTLYERISDDYEYDEDFMSKLLDKVIDDLFASGEITQTDLRNAANFLD